MADQIIHGNCWVAYLDILGFKNMLEESRMTVSKASAGRRPMHLDLFVKNHYGDVLDAIQRGNEWCRDMVSIAWFSDSFILFSHDDTLKSFGATIYSAGAFFGEAVCREMPLRGALSFGEFYADVEKGIFLGLALIDAYEYAEAQDWIGLVITPGAHKAYEQLQDSANLLSHHGFVEHDVFFKDRHRRSPEEVICRGKGIVPVCRRAILTLHRLYCHVAPKSTHERLFAYRPTESTLLGSVRTAICSMQRSTIKKHPKEYKRRHRHKYERTVSFLKSNPPVTWHRVDPHDDCSEEVE